MSINKAMKVFLEAATPEQKLKLATEANTSVQHLEHIRAGRRRAEAGLAIRLATASLKLHSKKLILDQRELCDACAECPIVDKRKPKVKNPIKAAILK
jgi:hypothetical protein